jgi:hypothetical protein
VAGRRAVGLRATPQSLPVARRTTPDTPVGWPGGPARREERLFRSRAAPNRGAAAASGAVSGRFTPRRRAERVATAAKTRGKVRLNGYKRLVGAVRSRLEPLTPTCGEQQRPLSGVERPTEAAKGPLVSARAGPVAFHSP